MTFPLRIGPSFLSEDFPVCQVMYSGRTVTCENVDVYIHASHDMNTSTGVGKGKLQSMVVQNSRCVVHCGSSGKGTTIDDTARVLGDIQLPQGHHIYIENAAGQKNQLGADWDEFRRLWEKLPQARLCIDTQHTFAHGAYDLRHRSEFRRLFNDVETNFGTLPHLIHLNDSKVDFGARVDRHEVVGSGYIWNTRIRSLKTLLRLASQGDVPIVSETPDPCADIELCHSLWPN